ncbi:MAG: hypothetical protein RQ745_00275 [Longimicrobiales bacterium]|nr:hypothetical protein [Longimicrobiales bacterium]
MIKEKWTRRVALLGIVSVGFGACSDNDDSIDDTPVGPGPTTPALAIPTGATAQALTNTLGIEVSWDAVQDAEGYLVTLSGGANEIQEVVTEPMVEFTGLAGRTEFTASIIAQAAGRTDSPAATAMATTGSLNEIFFNTADFNNLVADPGFDPSVFSAGSRSAPPNFDIAVPAGYTPATLRTDGLVPSVDGRTLQAVNYPGAIAPGTPLADQWHFGWTVWDPTGLDSRAATGLPIVDVATVQTNTTWASDTIYRLTQPVFVGTDCGADGSAPDCNAVTLTIEPGTTIVGAANVGVGIRGAYLIVSRGSRIIADATPGQPLDAPRRPTESETIVFTSERPLGSRDREDWGGLVINGQAPTNAGVDVEGEGDSGLYGGSDVNDDSGIIRGVRIEFAGDDVTPTDQLNGLALQGVGAGTTISYVQIHHNQDDGIEPFGGTASADHLVLTGIGDDSVDGTDGYQGFHQFVIIQQRGDRADQGLEISNNGDTEDAEPRSLAVLANVTAIGANSAVVSGDIAGSASDNAIQFREGTNYRVFNSIFQGFGESFCIRDAVSIRNALNRLDGITDPNATLSAEGIILWSNGGADDSPLNFAACGGGSS